MAQSEISPALYLIAMELDARKLIELATRRSEEAIETLLSSASDGRFTDPYVIAQTITAVIFGTVPAFCMRGHAPRCKCRGRKAANGYVSLLSRQLQRGIIEGT